MRIEPCRLGRINRRRLVCRQRRRQHYARLRKFRENFNDALKKVASVYPEARFDVVDSGFRLKPSPTHVGKLPPK